MELVEVAGLVVALLGLPAVAIGVVTHRRNTASAAFDLTLAHLRSHQPDLRRQALTESPTNWRSPQIPLLAKPDWLLSGPVPIMKVEIELDRSSVVRNKGARRVQGLSKALTYSEALAARPDMKGLFNGVVYRPTLIRVHDDRLKISFAIGKYFEYLDSSEVLAFEAAARDLASRRVTSGPYRRSVDDPFDLSARATSFGVNTLTIRKAHSPPHGFFMHRRGNESIANETQTLHVTPAGEFAPSDVSLGAVEDDFDLVRNVVREYAEEFLGVEDAYGKGGRTIDFHKDAVFSDLSLAFRTGEAQLHVLGVGLDPLCWKPELLTVCVFEPAVFSAIFSNLVAENDEGTIISGANNAGIPLTHANVNLYAHDANASPTASACLTLAWHWRDALGL